MFNILAKDTRKYNPMNYPIEPSNKIREVLNYKSHKNYINSIWRKL